MAATSLGRLCLPRRTGAVWQAWTDTATGRPPLPGLGQAARLFIALTASPRPYCPFLARGFSISSGHVMGIGRTSFCWTHSWQFGQPCVLHGLLHLVRVAIPLQVQHNGAPLRRQKGRRE